MSIRGSSHNGGIRGSFGRAMSGVTRAAGGVKSAFGKSSSGGGSQGKKNSKQGPVLPKR